jgi:hypothetical protein
MAVLAVFLIIAFLLTFQAVAELFKSGLSSLTGGKIDPPVDLIQATSANLLAIGAGLGLVLLGAVIVLPLVKFAIIGAGVVLLGIGLYNVYRTFTGKPGNTILPDQIRKG